MDSIRWVTRPELRRPKALLAFEGWNDASEGASGAATYFLDQYGDAECFAYLEPEEFVDFHQHRPTTEIVDGNTRRLSWPATRFYAAHLPHREHDAVVVMGDEPNLRWKTFSRKIVQVFAELDVEEVVTLGAFIGHVAHTVPVPVFATATDPNRVLAHDLHKSDYEGPVGIISVMLEACRETGIPATSLWAAAPQYLAANPNPLVMLGLFRKASQVLDLGADDSELAHVSNEFSERVTVAMESSPDFATYVDELERSDDTGHPSQVADSAELVEEIEQFLRDQS